MVLSWDASHPVVTHFLVTPWTPLVVDHLVEEKEGHKIVRRRERDKQRDGWNMERELLASFHGLFD